jgi:hypothetical protein
MGAGVVQETAGQSLVQVRHPQQRHRRDGGEQELEARGPRPDPDAEDLRSRFRPSVAVLGAQEKHLP